MKLAKFILSVCLLCSAFALSAQVNPSQTYVQGYYRSDGTYVQGHYKTNNNYTNRDNFTTKPNVNPYTSKPGYIEPDTKTIYSTPSNSTYSTPSNSYYNTTPSNTPTRTIYTGPNGGQYYINSNGNKTYIR